MAQQTHAQIIDAMAAINRSIRGINIAYGSTNLPQALVTFPAVMVLLGMEDYGRFGLCEYINRVFVADVTTGATGKAYQDCLTLSTAFHDTYTSISRVGDRILDRARVTTRLGFGNTGFAYTLKWGKGEFYGFSVLISTTSGVAGN